MSSKEKKLTVVLLRGDELPAAANETADPFCELELASQKFTSKIVKQSLNPDWTGQVFKFKGVEPNTDRLKITVNSQQNNNQPFFLGECYLSLDELPCNYPLELQLLLQDKGVPLNKGSIKIQVTAEEFGIDTQLYTKNDLINKIIANFHSSKDKLSNSIVCLETGEIYSGLKEAIEREKTKAVCKQCMTLLIFPGRYMIRNTIKLNCVPPQLYLFGVILGARDEIIFEPYNKKQFIFQVDPPEVQPIGSPFKLDIQLNNIRFDKNAKFLLTRTKGVLIRANMSEFGRLYRENPDQAKDNKQLAKVKPEELTEGNNLHETYEPPHTSSSIGTMASMYHVVIFRSDYDLRRNAK